MSIFDIFGYFYYENVVSNVFVFYFNFYNEYGL